MKPWVRECLIALRRLYYAGANHECPVCGSRVGRFKAMGARPAARCPVCGALERHRLIWLFCRDRTDLFDGRAKRLLHVAPEPSLARRLRTLAGLQYLGADLEGHHADVRMDVTAIQFADASFDVILCNHVLEHVPDDGLAMRELRRVLKPDGWAIMLVPIIGEHTREDPSVTDPQERERLYGQHDHVRQYGRDYADRLAAAGFVVEVIAYADMLAPAQRERYGLLSGEDIYLCRPALLVSSADDGDAVAQ